MSSNVGRTGKRARRVGGELCDAAAQVHTKKRDFFPLLLPHGSSIVQAL